MTTNDTDGLGSAVLDFVRVHIVNIAAIGLSLTEVEQWIRLAGMLAAAIYTLVKTVQVVIDIISKTRESKSRSKRG